MNATPAAQLQNMGINATLANVTAETYSAASTIVISACVKSRASRALEQKSLVPR